MRYLIGLIVLAVIIAGSYYFLNLSSGLEKRESEAKITPPIRLGFVGPLSSESMPFGLPIKNAVSLAVKDLKTQGRDIEVFYEDGRCSGEAAVQAINKLIFTYQVNLVIGGVCSGEIAAMAPIAEQNKVILFSPSASSANISHLGDFVFRNAPSDSQSGFTMAEMLGHKYKKVAIFSDNSEEALVFRGIFKDRFTELGGVLTIDSVIPPDTKEKDLKKSIKANFSGQEAEAADTEAIIINQETERLAGFLVKEIRAQKIKLPIYGTPIFASPKFLEIISNTVNPIAYMSLPELDRSNLRVQAFLQDYQRFYGPPFQEFYAAAAYDAANLLVQAVAVVGNDSLKIRDYLYNLAEYDGLIGKYSFDLNGDVVGIKFVLKDLGK